MYEKAGCSFDRLNMYIPASHIDILKLHSRAKFLRLTHTCNDRYLYFISMRIPHLANINFLQRRNVFPFG